jgi:hypothetical protein
VDEGEGEEDDEGMEWGEIFWSNVFWAARWWVPRWLVPPLFTNGGGGGWIARDSLNHLPSRLVRMPAPPSYPLPFSEEDGGMGPRMASHGAKATTPKMHGLSILSLLERESLHSAP